MVPGLKDAETLWIQSIWIRPPMVAGNIMIDDAKIGGITPATFILRGR
jgi:hypothetical protein